MRSRRAGHSLRALSSIAAAGLIAVLSSAEPSAQTARGKAFDTPQQAADALIDAADRFDVTELKALFGPAGADIVLSGEEAHNRERAREFVAEARKKTQVSVDPKRAVRAFVLVGEEDWPFPVPIVKRAGKWSFDAKAGRQESAATSSTPLPYAGASSMRSTNTR
jgi:hypothetical protein